MAPSASSSPNSAKLPYLKQYAAAARFFDDAFAKQPDLAEDLLSP